MALVLSTVLGMAVVAQGGGRVSGTIRDADRATGLSSATVLLVDIARSTLTDSAGRYAFTEVPAGVHRVVIRRLGYATRTLTISVAPSGGLNLDISLTPQPFPLPALVVRQTPTATDSVLDANRPVAARRVLASEFRERPGLAEADALRALEGHDVTMDPETPTGVHLNGGLPDQTGFLLDGIPVLNPYHGVALFGGWNPDALSYLDVSTALANFAGPPTLSGTIAATTHRLVDRVRSAGALSSTHGRLLVEAPVGTGSVSLSGRLAFPGFAAPTDPSYLRTAANDALAVARIPAFGGRARLVVVSNDNTLAMASLAPPIPNGPSHQFEWASRSIGLGWERRGALGTLSLVAYQASSEAGALWQSTRRPAILEANREDLGARFTLTRPHRSALTIAGFGVQRIAAGYRTQAVEGTGFDPSSRLMIATIDLEHRHRLGSRWSVIGGVAATGALGNFAVGPQAQLEWRPGRSVILSASRSRRHQFVHSLRNPESVVSNIFPVDLTVVANASGIPVGRSDQSTVRASVAIGANVTLETEGFFKRFDSLPLAALAPGPFVTERPGIGTGRAKGWWVVARFQRERLRAQGEYRTQRVDFTGRDRFQPSYAAGQSAAAELSVKLTPRLTVATHTTAIFDRRTTQSVGGFEWEACNLGDRGCEFAGAPELPPDGRGGVRLPAYLRWDVGVRRTWTVGRAGRPGQLAAFGTVTNLLGRKNTLTYLVDPTGALTPIEMRPRAPLVLGLEWSW